MSERRIAPYGTWKSLITSDLIVGQTVGLGSVAVDGGDIYWLESRPSEGGRSVLVRRDAAGKIDDVTPPPFNVRSRVHEYGGGAYAVRRGVVCFANFSDQRLYVIEPGEAARAVTPEGAFRFADLAFTPAGGHAICVREDHRAAGEPINTIVLIDLAGDADGGRVLADGHDFFAGPRVDPTGRELAWLSWDHPNMPWDGTDLWRARLAPDGSLESADHVAGGPAESILQPAWSPSGHLHFISDRTGWWNLYRAEVGEIRPLCPRDAEFGRPAWAFGTINYGFLDDGRIVLSYLDEGDSRPAILDGDRLLPIETPFSSAGCPLSYGDRLVIAGASTVEPGRIIVQDRGGGAIEVIRRGADYALDPADVSVGQAIEFSTTGARTAHAFFYPPTNKDQVAPAGELPPLIVLGHGGPTGASGRAFGVGIQFWTSRGFAVADVNYGGSTGYGRAYRQRLDGAWGVVDVDDCVHAAEYLAAQGLVDPDRLCIRGGSAGGYTTLCALTFHDTFKAGASHYGIGDLMALARDTHKFESRYLDRLIGPLPAAEAVYRQRSPINHTDRLNCPVAFFQGLDDKVVPPNQAEAMVAALKDKGLPVAYLAFEGEGHGFRQAKNIKRALEGELYFYGRVFGFTPADKLEPLDIANL